MFSIATFLDRVKRTAKIDSDYQLAKMIGITQSAISNYRMGKTLPDARVLTKLCSLAKEDLAIVAAEVEAARAKTDEARTLWSLVASRLQGTAVVVALTACGAISFVAPEAQAMQAPALFSPDLARSCLYIMLSVLLLSRSIREELPRLIARGRLS